MSNLTPHTFRPMGLDCILCQICSQLPSADIHDDGPEAKIHRRAVRVCGVDGCGRPPKGKYCEYHDAPHLPSCGLEGVQARLEQLREGCVVTGDGRHRDSERANGIFCDFCGEQSRCSGLSLRKA